MVRQPARQEGSVLYLVAKGLWRVVHNHSLLEIPTEDVELLDEVAAHTHTVVAEEPVLDEPAAWIQQLQQLLSIRLRGGSEEDHLQWGQRQWGAGLEARGGGATSNSSDTLSRKALKCGRSLTYTSYTLSPYSTLNRKSTGSSWVRLQCTSVSSCEEGD